MARVGRLDREGGCLFGERAARVGPQVGTEQAAGPLGIVVLPQRLERRDDQRRILGLDDARVVRGRLDRRGDLGRLGRGGHDRRGERARMRDVVDRRGRLRNDDRRGGRTRQPADTEGGRRPAGRQKHTRRHRQAHRGAYAPPPLMVAAVDGAQRAPLAEVRDVHRLARLDELDQLRLPPIHRPLLFDQAIHGYLFPSALAAVSSRAVIFLRAR